MRDLQGSHFFRFRHYINLGILLLRSFGSLVNIQTAGSPCISLISYWIDSMMMTTYWIWSTKIWYSIPTNFGIKQIHLFFFVACTARYSIWYNPARRNVWIHCPYQEYVLPRCVDLFLILSHCDQPNCDHTNNCLRLLPYFSKALLQLCNGWNKLQLQAEPPLDYWHYLDMLNFQATVFQV